LYFEKEESEEDQSATFKRQHNDEKIQGEVIKIDDGGD
jgi:hypothetical protein